jgi:hypothetical protein
MRTTRCALVTTIPWLVVSTLAGCAHPATDVEVKTQSMRQALDGGQGSWRIEQAHASARTGLATDTLPSADPTAWASTPTIAVAYVYEWIDRRGNRHLGEWVLVPVSGFDWDLNKRPDVQAPVSIAPSSP